MSTKKQISMNRVDFDQVEGSRIFDLCNRAMAHISDSNLRCFNRCIYFLTEYGAVCVNFDIRGKFGDKADAFVYIIPNSTCDTQQSKRQTYNSVYICGKLISINSLKSDVDHVWVKIIRLFEEVLHGNYDIVFATGPPQLYFASHFHTTAMDPSQN